MNGFKLWYSGGSKDRNGVGILVDENLRDYVVEARRVNDRMMFIKLVVGRYVVNVVSAYAPQVGLDEEVKSLFWRIWMRLCETYQRQKKSSLGVTLMGISGQLLAGLKMFMEALVLGRGMEVGRLSWIFPKPLS